EDETDDGEGDTLGLVISDKAGGQRLVFIAACAEVTPAIAEKLDGADLVFFDGTLWRDDEMIRAGLGKKTGQRMGHVSMAGDSGAIDSFRALGVQRKIFLHINNTNPAHHVSSPERAELERA